MIQPEIYYEDEISQLTNGFPFMKIEDDKIPKVLFIAAMKNSEINENDEQVVDLAMQLYINSEILKSVLDKEQYNNIRRYIGLKDL